MEEARKHHARIGLRGKLLWAFVLLALLPMTLIPTYLNRKLSHELSQIERDELQLGARQLDQALDSTKAKLLQSTRDYAHWDQAVESFVKQDQSWFQREVFDYVVKNYQYDFVIVSDLQGKVIWQYQSPERMKGSVFHVPVVQAALVGDEKVGFADVDDGLAFVSAARIMPLSNEHLPVADSGAVGIMMFGQRIDDAYAKILATTIARDVAFFTPRALVATNDASKFTGTGVVSPVLREDIQEFDQDDLLYLYVPVRAANGIPVGSVRIAQSRNSINFVRFELVRTVAVLFLAGILTLGLLALLLRAWLVMPLLNLTHAFAWYGKYRKITHKELAAHRDEVGDLYRSFTSMVSHLETSEQELLHRDKELSSVNKKLTAATKRLEDKVTEVQRLNRFMIGREVRMAELKKQLRSSGIAPLKENS